MNAPSLREQRRKDTQTDILDAYLALAHREGAMTVSVPAVAAESRVSVRTVYRYFATKGDMQTAAALRLSETAASDQGLRSTTRHNLVEQLSRLWSRLARNIPAVLAEQASPAGRAQRQIRLVEAREHSASAFVFDADPQTVDLVIAVTSNAMFLELVERMGYAPEVAARMAARAANLIFDDEEQAIRIRREKRP